MFVNMLRGCKEGRPSLFSVVSRGRRRSDIHKLKHRMFPLKIFFFFFTVQVTEHCHKLPREPVESLSLEILKGHLSMFLNNCL